MLKKEVNEYGVITLNEALIQDIFSEAIKPWEGKARYIGEKEIRFGEDGLFAYAGLSIKLGVSISSVCGSIISFIADAAEKYLELDIEDIVLDVLQMTTSKASVKRNIRVSYRGGNNEEIDQ